MKQHRYTLELSWTGNSGNGTADYRSYERSHAVKIDDKKILSMSSDPAFRGDASKHNPEDLLLASLSSCHMLWYLHLCADAGIVVTAYTDKPVATMVLNADGSGKFTEVILNPVVVITDAARIADAMALHEQAHTYCFIANSVNFPVLCAAAISV